MRRIMPGAHALKTCRSIALLVMPLSFVGCGSPKNAAQNSLAFTSDSRGAATRQRSLPNSLDDQVMALDSAVSRWQRAPDLTSAHQAAEEARNLIVGPAGPYYGDADGDGIISGANSVGILPGRKGEAGLASSKHNPCVVADVLGGSWRNPAERWATLETAISRWTSVGNTFPYLPSHLQRVVGWASLALKARSLVAAREYAKHAHLHVNVAMKAVTQCQR